MTKSEALIQDLVTAAQRHGATGVLSYTPLEDGKTLHLSVSLLIERPVRGGAEGTVTVRLPPQ